ncbi:DUF2231 domain-containing protein [Actinomadura livida]|uniref:DUF2231 domain-containing protein n=1 Tax=Actinomadura livida TaxID=79909 RepID=A0A7W7N085_9ACTN|nr:MULTISPECIES: DUF2231 domain-containing protein [Actinomadura]MBB4777741.1 putative membrane protein [Actinomadura catellatispora]GGT99066.1 membrane protein [Actinomadura livida]
MDDPQYRAKQPVSPLAGGYGHPLHPILVTVPIGAWVSSLVIDVAAHLGTGPPSAAEVSLWLIGLGIAGALAAAATGFLDLLAIPPGTRAFRTALSHMSLNLAATFAYVAGFGWRLGDGAVSPAQTALSAASLACLAAAGYLGGKLAYRYGVRVADENTQAEGFVRPSRRTQS